MGVKEDTHRRAAGCNSSSWARLAEQKQRKCRQGGAAPLQRWLHFCGHMELVDTTLGAGHPFRFRSKSSVLNASRQHSSLR